MGADYTHYCVLHVGVPIRALDCTHSAPLFKMSRATSMGIGIAGIDNINDMARFEPDCRSC